MMDPAFEAIQEQLHRLLRERHDDRSIKMISIGTDRPGESHWRFKLLSGETVIVRIEREP